MRVLGVLVAFAFAFAAAGCSWIFGLREPVVTDTGDDGARRDGPPNDTRPVDSGVDAPPAVCDPSACGSVGGTCMAGTCVITEPFTGSSNPISCPTVGTCEVDCPYDNTCHAGISCSPAATCTMNCEGDHTCDQGSTISCGSSSRCEVFCTGTHACGSLTLQCSPSATCIYHCCGASSCVGFQCTGPGCTMGGSICP